MFFLPSWHLGERFFLHPKSYLNSASSGATPFFANLVESGSLESNVFSFYMTRGGVEGSELCLGCVNSEKYTGSECNHSNKSPLLKARWVDYCALASCGFFGIEIKYYPLATFTDDGQPIEWDIKVRCSRHFPLFMVFCSSTTSMLWVFSCETEHRPLLPRFHIKEVKPQKMEVQRVPCYHRLGDDVHRRVQGDCKGVLRTGEQHLCDTPRVETDLTSSTAPTKRFPIAVRLRKIGVREPTLSRATASISLGRSVSGLEGSGTRLTRGTLTLVPRPSEFCCFPGLFLVCVSWLIHYFSLLLCALRCSGSSECVGGIFGEWRLA